MSLRNSMNQMFRDAELGYMATDDPEKLKQYSVGNFDDIDDQDDLPRFYTGGPIKERYGDYAYKGRTYQSRNVVSAPSSYHSPKPAPRGFLETVGSAAKIAFGYAKEAYNGLKNFMQKPSVKELYTDLKNIYRDYYFDDEDNFNEDKLFGGSPTPSQFAEKFVPSSARARGVAQGQQFTAKDVSGGRRISPVQNAIAHAAGNANINKSMAALIMSNKIDTTLANLPVINTGINVAKKVQYYSGDPTKAAPVVNKIG